MMKDDPERWIIRIYSECEGGVENLSPGSPIGIMHEACRVMTNGDLEGQIFAIPSSHK